MSKYLFESEYFGLSDESIHLLRNRFNYETLDHKEVSMLELKRGRLVNNWLVLFVMGIILIGCGVLFMLKVYHVFGGTMSGRIYVEEIVASVLFLMIGGFCIWNALRKGLLLQVQMVNGKRKSFPLNKVEQAGELQKLQNLLKDHPHFSGCFVSQMI